MQYSVIMSVYKKDRPEWLVQAIDSLLTQTVKSNDIIIVADGPLTLELDKVLRRYSNDDSVSLVRLKENKGLGNALNVGIKRAKNELIGRMDSDDIAVFNRFELQIAAFEDDPNLDILGGQIAEFVDTPEQITAYRNVPIKHDDICRFARRRSPFNHPTVMYRGETIQRLGGYDVSAIRLEDYDLWLRAIHNNANCANLDDILLNYRSDRGAVKRRKTLESLRSHLRMRGRFYRRGYISIVDYFWGVTSQLILFLIPASLADFLFRRLLRHG